ncbi:NADH-dependent flavin oxidoreductase [Virgibacillus alimentarius]|uniref:2,4-dienoyl-CoA reductase-like NADH-dependent reductase (Old Yellow Enzyme family) n=1 Tax=Virgibacillus alimentarius TaxID=698769 RepID=A0ABS4S836_9BACI|nr:NADH-dependent flavin oxidoreductase [Virgibacillus alimentarius]MBP2257648.1 2,4-dienoyl-CoA reductase-like NADH-dependent reductase (Old Yellow Enzyme family) [Virgibacillus alimentarius]
MNEKYQPLFESFSFPNGTRLKNRVVMAPMTNWSSNSDGTVSDDEVKYYKRRSKGVSMVVTACANVTAGGKGFSGEIGVHNDDMIPGLRRLATTIQEQGAKAVLQIYHGGRLCPPDLVPNGDIVSASAVPPGENGPVPRALEDGEIKGIIHAYGEGTRRAIQAGFDGVEIHGANGYLIHQFFSPHSNRRDDHWGGSLKKRMNFPLAVINEIQKTVNDHAKDPFIVGHRLSPEEPQTPGITMADTLEFVDVLSDKELDYIHVSQMNFWSRSRRGVEDTRSRIEIIQDRIGNKVPVIGVGSIYSAEDAQSAIQSDVPLLALGRELIIDPDWVGKIEQGKASDIETILDTNGQERLVVPNPLWKAIIHTPGWFPGVD